MVDEARPREDERREAGRIESRARPARGQLAQRVARVAQEERGEEQRAAADERRRDGVAAVAVRRRVVVVGRRGPLDVARARVAPLVAVEARGAQQVAVAREARDALQAREAPPAGRVDDRLGPEDGPRGRDVGPDLVARRQRPGDGGQDRRRGGGRAERHQRRLETERRLEQLDDVLVGRVGEIRGEVHGQRQLLDAQEPPPEADEARDVSPVLQRQAPLRRFVERPRADRVEVQPFHLVDTPLDGVGAREQPDADAEGRERHEEEQRVREFEAELRLVRNVDELLGHAQREA